MSKETAIAKVEEGPSFLVLQQEDPQALQEVLDENLGGGDFSMGDLDVIKVPAGGMIAWTLTDEDGKEDVQKEFVGVIVAQRLQRSLYTKPYTGESNPPDCYSADGKCGVGTPGGSCAGCKFDAWGSAANGGGKACRERKMLYILRPGDMLPCVLSVPATSLGNLRKYMTRLSGKGVSALSAVTAFSLVKVQSGSGIAYSQVSFRLSDKLTPEQTAQIRAYSKKFDSLLDKAQAYAPATAAATPAAPLADVDADGDNPFDEVDGN